MSKNFNSFNHVMDQKIIRQLEEIREAIISAHALVSVVLNTNLNDIDTNILHHYWNGLNYILIEAEKNVDVLQNDICPVFITRHQCCTQLSDCEPMKKAKC